MERNPSQYFFALFSRPELVSSSRLNSSTRGGRTRLCRGQKDKRHSFASSPDSGETRTREHTNNDEASPCCPQRNGTSRLLVTQASSKSVLYVLPSFVILRIHLHSSEGERKALPFPLPSRRSITAVASRNRQTFRRVLGGTRTGTIFILLFSSTNHAPVLVPEANFFTANIFAKFINSTGNSLTFAWV